MDQFLNTFLGAALGFIGTIVGAGITWWVTNGATNRQTTFDLHREFNSEPLLTSRHAAQNIGRLFDGNDKETLDRMFGQLTSEERSHIWNVIHFYEKLYVMIKYKRCNTKLIPELFGEVFYWWYMNCLESKLAPARDREASIRISGLKTWLDKHSKPEDIARWVKRAQRTRKSTDEQPSTAKQYGGTDPTA